MTQERELTRCESFGLAQGLTKTLHDWDQSQNHPIMGKVGARVIGVVVTPLASAIDAIAHLILFGAKLVIATVLLPYNFIATLFIPSIALPKDLEISSSLVHLTRSAESVIGIVTLPVMCFFDPGRASAIANHKNYNADTQKASETKDPKKVAGSRKRKRSAGAKSGESRKAAKTESKADLKALLSEVEKNSEVLGKELEAGKKKTLSDFNFGSKTTLLTDVPANADTGYMAGFALDSVDPMLDDLNLLAADGGLHSMWDDLHALEKEIEALKMKPLSLDAMLDELDVLAEMAETDHVEEPGAALEELIETAANPPKKSDFKFDPNPGPMPEPKKLNVKDTDFSLLANSLKQKSNLADKLKQSKAKPGLSELVPEAVKQVKPMIASNKNAVAGALKQTQEQLAAEHDEKVKKLKPVYGSVMEELKAKSEEIEAKGKKAHEKMQEKKAAPIQAAVVFSDLSVKARKKLMNEMGSDIEAINAFLATLTKEEAALLFGVGAGKVEVSDQDGMELDAVELNSDFDLGLNIPQAKAEVGTAPLDTNVELEQIPFNAPALFLEEGDAIVKYIAKRSWQTDGQELEEKRREMLNMLSSVRRYNREWNLKSSLPSPYALAEKKLYELARFVELDRDAALSGLTNGIYSAFTVHGEADEEGLTGVSVLHVLEEVSECLITINLMDKEVQENQDDWDTGLNARRYIKANEALHQMQKLALESNLSTRLAGFLQEAEDAVKLITDMTVDEILELPLAKREELEPATPLPFSQGLRAEIEAIRQNIQAGTTTQNEALIRMKTLYALWKSQGSDLNDGVDEFEDGLYQADKALYLQGPLAGSHVVKEGIKALQVIRSSALKMKFRTYETLDAEHQERARASHEAMTKLKSIQTSDNAEMDALEAIFQEAYAYTQMGYADQTFTTDDTIDEVLADLVADAERFSENVEATDKPAILAMYERIVAYRAQWEFEDRVLASFKKS